MKEIIKRRKEIASKLTFLIPMRRIWSNRGFHSPQTLICFPALYYRSLCTFISLSYRPLIFFKAVPYLLYETFSSNNNNNDNNNNVSFFCFHCCLSVICFVLGLLFFFFSNIKHSLWLSTCSNLTESRYNESNNIADLFNTAALNTGYKDSLGYWVLELQLRVVKIWISELRRKYLAGEGEAAVSRGWRGLFL